MAVKIKPMTAGWIMTLVYLGLVLGFVVPQTRDFTRYLIWPVLLLTTITLLAFHKKWTKEFVFSVLLLAATGFLLEVAALKTGYLYGYFQFGPTLGYRFWDTPLMMAACWFTTLYVTRQVAEMIAKDAFLVSILASAMMLLIAYFMEPFAIKHGLWSWNGGHAGVHKYAGYFIAGLLVQYIYCKSIKNPSNKLSLVVYLVQLGFYMALYLLGK
jgi:uncharacterized membrane protein